MNDDGRAGLLDFTESRLAARDAARDEYLRREMAREPVVGERLCRHGHDDWGEKKNGKYVSRYCRTCNKLRMDARRNES